MNTQELLDKLNRLLKDETDMSYKEIQLVLDEIKQHVISEYNTGYDHGCIDSYHL